VRPLPALAAAGAAVVIAAGALHSRGFTPVQLVPATAVAAAAILAIGYLVWMTDPAVTLTAGIVLAPLAGNWQQLGIPGAAAPDRLLVIGGVATALLRVRRSADAPRLQFGPVHAALVLAVFYAAVSAAAAHTLFEKTAFLKLVEAYGILPFLVFAVGPLVFRTSYQRNVLLAGLVALGAYLGLTVLFETTGPDALVYPRYINDFGYGIHAGRGRGPFVDAVANGFGLFTCSVAAAIAVITWRQSWARISALAVGVLCLFGTLLTLERSVWVGTIIGIVTTLAVVPRLRRYLLPVAAAGALVVVGGLAVVPGLRDKVQHRANDEGPVWDRKNLTHAAFAMIKDRPAAGFGWARFTRESDTYFQQSPDYPLTATTANLHSFFLTYAVELGLPGLIVWLTALGLAIVGVVTTRGPPELDPWRYGFSALAIFFLVGAAFVPPTVFQNLTLWLWAGVVWAGRYSTAR
jgi:O-antigen ligase